MSRICVGRLWYPVVTLGYGRRLGVWAAGCRRECAGCISPELRDFSAGSILTPEQILERIPPDAEPDGLTISGGEPFEQAAGILELVKLFQNRYTEDILIFTGYTIEELHRKRSGRIREILDRTAVLVDGRYIEGRNSQKGLRGSDNQRIHVFKFHERYDNAEEQERRLQCVRTGDRLWMIGIPPA